MSSFTENYTQRDLYTEQLLFNLLASVRANDTSGSVGGRQFFGWFLIFCGTMAMTANALILLAVTRYLKYRNALFVIITNFAIIDELKSLCAIYMGFLILQDKQELRTTPVVTSRLFIIKLMQIATFVMYIGNLCSVFNLVLATVNEFLYIKCPLTYRKWVNRRRVYGAVLCTWLLAFMFSIAKALHRGERRVMVANNASFYGMQTLRIDVDGDGDHLVAAGGEQATNSGQREQMYRKQFEFSDMYTLILIGCLLVCLVIIAAVYFDLYMTIRRAELFRKRARRGSHEVLNKIAVRAAPIRRAYRQTTTRMPPETLALRKFQSMQHEHRTFRNVNTLPMPETSTPSRGEASYDLQEDVCHATPRMYTTDSSGDTVASRRVPQIEDSTISEARKSSSAIAANGNPSGLRRYKCVFIILVVCLVNFVYLALYFSLQLFHVLHVAHGVATSQLRSKFVVQHALRALFVLHATLNPLIFFRIRSFRSTFMQMLCRRRRTALIGQRRGAVCTTGGARRSVGRRTANSNNARLLSITACSEVTHKPSAISVGGGDLLLSQMRYLEESSPQLRPSPNIIKQLSLSVGSKRSRSLSQSRLKKISVPNQRFSDAGAERVSRSTRNLSARLLRHNTLAFINTTGH